MLMIQGIDGLLAENLRLREEVRVLRAFRARVVEAVVAHRLACDCIGYRHFAHEPHCPLGELEREADERWRKDTEGATR